MLGDAIGYNIYVSLVINLAQPSSFILGTSYTKLTLVSSKIVDAQLVLNCDIID